MILNSLDKQLVLAENGQITWQRDLTNPMPGEVVAEIKKGTSILCPSCSLVSSPATDNEDKDAVLTFVQEWLTRYIETALEPLFKLKADDIPAGAPQNIADMIYDSLGVIPRDQLQSQISQMDEDQRGALRTKKIRFGPLLVYLPELNKPAAVKLRALLVTLFEDKDLPATVPADGIVSFSIEGQDLDKAYYQSIGYPIYGPRSIRVDMLDRVICAVYDTAKEGKFMAQHQMAEWLGSNIADLYAVLEAMGHKKIHDPADEVKAETEKLETLPTQENAKPMAAEAVAENIKDNVPAETVKEVSVTDGKENSSTKEPEKEQAEKPALATFALKKGKAIDKPDYAANSNAGSHSKNKKFENNNFKSDKKKYKPNKTGGKKGGKREQPRERVYVAEAKSNPEDSPFAILQQLKTADKD